MKYWRIIFDLQRKIYSRDDDKVDIMMQDDQHIGFYNAKIFAKYSDCKVVDKLLKLNKIKNDFKYHSIT